MQPFLAMILPVGGGGGEPTHPIAPGGQPGAPSHPIYYPGAPAHPWVPPPLGTWGGRPPNYVDIGGPGNQPYPGQGLPGNQPYPGQGLPGNQPYPDQSLPGQQPGIWGPIFYPDQGLPGQRPSGGRPTHPIYYPPVIWDPSRPTNPIANPGDPNNPSGEQQPKIEWKTAWSPTTGWVVVGVPTGPTPTPSQDDDQL